MKMKNFTYFCECYLHQDFDLEFPNFEEALQTFLRLESGEKIFGFVAEIETILKEYSHETQLLEFMENTFYYNYTVLRNWLSYTSWLSYTLEQAKTSKNYLPCSQVR